MRALAIVAHEESTAIFQAAVYVYDGNARAVRAVRNPVARLQNETALSNHLRIVPSRLTSSAL
jgi:hypothetical protein